MRAVVSLYRRVDVLLSVSRAMLRVSKIGAHWNKLISNGRTVHVEETTLVSCLLMDRIPRPETKSQRP